MIRRKNNEIQYIQPRQDLSPNRFQRKGINISPGLSPMRMRTPTRNVSPFRINNGIVNDQRTHSPIRFVGRKQQFRRPQISNYQQNVSHKYTTGANDHSRRQSYYQNDNSYLRNQQASKHVAQDNTKLFSQLVSKLNSDKKKQIEQIKKNTKLQRQQNMLHEKCLQAPKLTKQKSHPQQSRPIQNQITQIQSVVYEVQNANQHRHQYATNQYHQHSINQYQQHSTHSVNQVNDHSLKVSSKIDQRKAQLEAKTVKNIKSKIVNPLAQNDKFSKQPTNSNQKKHQAQNQFQNQVQKQMSHKVQNNIQNQEDEDFDDVKMYFDLMKNSIHQNKMPTPYQPVQICDVNASLMNMNPFI